MQWREIRPAVGCMDVWGVPAEGLLLLGPRAGRKHWKLINLIFLISWFIKNQYLMWCWFCCSSFDTNSGESKWCWVRTRRRRSSPGPSPTRRRCSTASGRPAAARTSRRRERSAPSAGPTSRWAGRRSGGGGGPRPSTARPTPPGSASGWRRSTWPSRSCGSCCPRYRPTRNCPRSRSSDWRYATSPTWTTCWMCEGGPPPLPLDPSPGRQSASLRPVRCRPVRFGLGRFCARCCCASLWFGTNMHMSRVCVAFVLNPTWKQSPEPFKNYKNSTKQKKNSMCISITEDEKKHLCDLQQLPSCFELSSNQKQIQICEMIFKEPSLLPDTGALPPANLMVQTFFSPSSSK